jgi:ATP-dependent RNA helicase DDX35
MAFRRPGSLSKGEFGVSYPSKFRDAPPERESFRPDDTQRSTSLPVAQYRKQLLYLLEKHATVIIVGETGCGKTTQIPQYLHEAGWTAQGHQVTSNAIVAVQ